MSNWLPSLNSLRAFEVVSRHLNYHSAAGELKVTPAAVKQLVSKLENTIGGKLLERQGQKLVLTAKGMDCSNDLSSGFDHLYASVHKMRGSRKKNQLIVSVETSFATTWLVPKLDQFRSRHSEISVLIDSNQSILDIENSQIDVAIRYGVKNKENLISHRLFDDLIFPACSPALLCGPPKLLSLQDLNSVPLIHWDMSQLSWATETRRWFEWNKWFARYEVDIAETQQGLHFSDYGQAVQAAIAGQGVLLASWPILKEPIDAGVLVRPFEEKVMMTDIGYDVVTTPTTRDNYEVKSFIEWIVEMAETAKNG